MERPKIFGRPMHRPNSEANYFVDSFGGLRVSISDHWDEAKSGRWLWLIDTPQAFDVRETESPSLENAVWQVEQRLRSIFSELRFAIETESEVTPSQEGDEVR